MRNFTIITKDGSKWLSRTAPHGVDPIQWHSDNHDLPYTDADPCINPLAPYQVTVTVQIDQFDNVTLTCPAGHTFSAKSEGLADFFHKSNHD